MPRLASRRAEAEGAWAVPRRWSQPRLGRQDLSVGSWMRVRNEKGGTGPIRAEPRRLPGPHSQKPPQPAQKHSQEIQNHPAAPEIREQESQQGAGAGLLAGAVRSRPCVKHTQLVPRDSGRGDFPTLPGQSPASPKGVHRPQHTPEVERRGRGRGRGLLPIVLSTNTRRFPEAHERIEFKDEFRSWHCGAVD